MRFRLLLSLLLAFVPLAGAVETEKISVNWTRDSRDESWKNRETGMVLPKTFAGFKIIRAEPNLRPGDSGFTYHGPTGVITIIFEHRIAAGFPGRGDCTNASRNNYLQVMHQDYGKTDSEQSFRLQFSGSGKQGKGVGTLCHFVAFPMFDGKPAYSEVGVVLIGDHLLEYRGSFITQEGLKTLNDFLQALGVRKS